ncbi:MAG: trigger factor, partial [Clostridia bacterium]|nr:trigger factor [Clostridia bacterium]
MQYKYEPAEKSTVKITIDFNGVEWQNAVSKSYVKNKSRYPVNGFRKGKAPKHVIENFYGKGVFYEDALNTLYNENFGTIVEKEKDNFIVVGDPALSVEALSDDGVTLVAVTPVKPDVAIEGYTGIKVREYVYNVKDEDVDAEVEKLRERNARQVAVEGRAAQNGDICNINFTGSVDGVEFDGGAAEQYDLTLGSGTFIPGFEDQVVGMNVGETKDVKVTFPENYPAENLKNKEAVFVVKLNGIKAKELPEVTDEFIKDATG